MNRIKIIIKGCLFLGLLSTLISAAFAYEEKVHLKKIISDNQLVIKRKNHEVYKLEIGLGCTAISRYEGGKIRIYTSGSGPAFNAFVDPSSKVLLKKAAQECVIWSAKKLHGEGNRGIHNTLSYVDQELDYPLSRSKARGEGQG